MEGIFVSGAVASASLGSSVFVPPSNPVDPAVRELWQRVRTALRQEAGDHVFDAWLAPVAILGCDGDLVRLAAPSAFDADWVNSNYGDSLRRHFAAQNPALRRVSVTAAGPAASPVPSRAMPQSAPSQPLPVDARYNFDNFIVGKANELAYNAALTMAEPGAPGFNPLFLHGATGLGKTHLMHAIGNAFLARHPQARVAYLSAEKFMVEFMAAMRAKDTISFKQRLRSVDLLMIDDVQFIAGKDSTQEEFFHTMNEIIGAGKRLVITADRSPQNLEGIQERILSRMAWGLVADINPADYELRLNILQAKVATLGNRVQVPDDVVEFLARKITANVRELEGALNRVTAFALLIGKPITLEFTRETLADLLRAHEKKLTIDEIQRKVADYYGLRLADLLSERRAREVARPRQIAMYLAKKMTPRSLPEIGRRFGNRDHTTVMHAVKKVEELRAKDREIDSDVATLARLLDG
ncbi:chromosomal replication initiation protein DnaA [Sandarakinorhabdus cyanobacteriorum]|uniref:Chromosomal replication initiator protein DnaA n=1 Tax=Sandarakinorhabdus cyanobacteriorum TaxID=1981098 RepID=A0A255YPH3_9SPHN|nr:chromosomal replication initiation protein DnaA [Sandarakinorhabdus cyanobacteriorum]